MCIDIYIANFYQVRNLEPNMIPFSTALGEPTWYHDNKDRSYCFVDKNGVYNGLVAKPFQFDETLLTDVPCSKNCEYKPPNCPFMLAYRKSIERTDFNDILTYLINEVNKVREITNFKGRAAVILLVYEKPEIQCAERPVIQQYFKDHGYEVKEWTPDLIYKNILF